MGLINKRITFEIVETTSINDYLFFNEFFKAIRNNGAKIAIDDFGQGFSNFSHISNIEFDYLKIDGHFIRNIFTNKNVHIVESIVNFCKKNNIKVIAEYVENEAIYKKICDLNVDYSQGYYFGRAMPELISKNTKNYKVEY